MDTMCDFEFTLPDPDPLAVEVSLRPDDPPFRWLSVDLRDKLTAAAVPGATLRIELLAAAGVEICEKAFSIEAADREVVTLICWVALQTGVEATWLDGQREEGGYRAQLPLKIREWLYYLDREFDPYWSARGLIVDRFINYIRKLSIGFGVRFYSEPADIFLDEPRGTAEPSQSIEECTHAMVQAARLAGARHPEDDAALSWFFDQVRELAPHPARQWIDNLPQVAADWLEHQKRAGRLPALHTPLMIACAKAESSGSEEKQRPATEAPAPGPERQADKLSDLPQEHSRHANTLEANSAAAERETPKRGRGRPPRDKTPNEILEVAAAMTNPQPVDLARRIWPEYDGLNEVAKKQLRNACQHALDKRAKQNG
jgi:hypothetical protein